MAIVVNKGVTQINVAKELYVWEISNFTLHRKSSGRFISSPIFYTDSGKSEWNLHLYPKGVSRDNGDRGWIGIFLNSIKREQPMYHAEVAFSILVANYKIERRRDDHRWDNWEPTYRGSAHVVRIDEVSDYLVNDTLTVVCEIRACTEKHSTIVTSKESLPTATGSSSTDVNLEKLSEDFGKLMETQHFDGDVVLVASGERIQAHKTILSARSPVFSALFSHDMRESKENSITIEDAEPGALKEMLCFIYTGKVKNLDKLAYELFTLSDKYGLDGLKKMCEDSLSNDITTDNVIDILILSDHHSADILKNKALSFIKANSSTVINTEQYKALEKTKSPLISEILRAIVTK